MSEPVYALTNSNGPLGHGHRGGQVACLHVEWLHSDGVLGIGKASNDDKRVIVFS